jgi:hypothetical protein
VAGKRGQIDQGNIKEVTMSQLALYGTAIGFSFIAWWLVTSQYLWPELRRRSNADALRPLLLLHNFRFIGLAFLIPGVVSPDLPAAFAAPAAYGDLAAAALALLALAAGLETTLGIALVWVFNLWGIGDLLYAFYQGNRVGLQPGQLGATYFIVVVLVPLLVITHGLMFRLLLRRSAAAASSGPA